MTMASFLRGHPQQSSGSEWADNVLRQAQRAPAPLVYPESHWMPRTPDYAMPGRVYDPADIMRTQQALRQWPPVQDEMGEQFVPQPPTFADTGFAGFLRNQGR
jgi:hypothetical protein